MQPTPIIVSRRNKVLLPLKNVNNYYPNEIFKEIIFYD